MCAGTAEGAPDGRGGSPAGHWAVVTGASRGIGAAVARHLAQDGYSLALVASSEHSVSEIRSEFEGQGSPVMGFGCDFTDRQAVDELGARLVDALPAVGVLVNNAGIVAEGPTALHQRGVQWDRVLDVNLRAAFELTAALAPSLRRTQGRVVNVGSVLGSTVLEGTAAYAVSKAGLHHLTRMFAVELAGSGIRVNAVAPGYVRTDMVNNTASAERQAQLASATPLGRLGSVDEVAAVVSFLCSPAASYVSGAVIAVDGALGCRSAVPPSAEFTASASTP